MKFVFVLYKENVAAEPVIRTFVLKNRSEVVTYMGTVLHGMIFWCVFYYAPLYFEAVKGYSPIIAGVSIIPEN